MLWLDLLVLFIGGALFILLFTMAANLLIFPKLSSDDTSDEDMLVSVLIPARNEAAVIGETVSRLLAQRGVRFELLVMDDHSEDGTLEIALQAAGGDERLRVLESQMMPSGWMGKSWACWQLAQAARGEVLLFTDADVQWEAGALASVVAQMTHNNVDMVTVWSTQITETMAERLTVPLMAMVILGYLPTVMVHYSPFKAFAAANGQCMAWRREAYEAIGGHTAVANNVLDDVTMAQLAKEKGYRIRMVDGAGLVCARMYDGWQSARDGYAKNILAGYGNSVLALVAGGIFHWLVFLVPYGLLFVPEYRSAGIALLVMGFALRAVSAFWTRQRVIDALLMPISVLMFTWIAGQSIYWHYTGGARWKGRIIGESKSTQTDIRSTQKPIIRTDEG